jgi:hypothetical protein
LAVELGLHHNPLPLISTGQFTEDECQHRLQLWSIVISIDRETSIICGRPLSITPSDIDAPWVDPTRLDGLSSHFIAAHFISQIQADIVSLGYAPLRRDRSLMVEPLGTLLRRIDKFDHGLPQSYESYFATNPEAGFPASSLTDDQALSLSKLSLTRILLLRVLFNSETVSYNTRRRSLWDGELYRPYVLITFVHIALSINNSI